MRRCPFWVLLLATCSGSPGELGQGDFEYYCVGVGDPYCDCDEHAELCYAGGNPAIEQIPYHRVPEGIAVGASFRLRFDLGSSEATVVSASPAMLSDGEVLQAQAAGEVAVLAMRGDWVHDFFHLRLVTPTRARVDRVDAPAHDTDTLTLAVGETAWLRTVPETAGEVLYGELPCAWSLDQAQVVQLGGVASDNVVSITGLAPGATMLSVELGPVQAGVVVTVTDSSELEAADAGGAP